jgi:hypothetical protein
VLADDVHRFVSPQQIAYFLNDPGHTVLDRHYGHVNLATRESVERLGEGWVPDGLGIGKERLGGLV